MSLNPLYVKVNTRVLFKSCSRRNEKVTSDPLLSSTPSPMPSHNAFEPFDKFVKVAVFRVVLMEVRYFGMCRQRQWHRVRTVVVASSACHRGSASLSGGQRESRTCTHYPSPGRHGVQHNTMSFSRARSIHRCVCMFAVLLALAILSLLLLCRSSWLFWGIVG